MSDKPATATPWGVALTILAWSWSVLWAVFTVIVGVSPAGAAENIAGWLRLIGLTRAADYFARNPTVAVPLPEFGDEIIRTGPLEIPELLIISLIALAVGIYLIRALNRAAA